MANPTDPVRAGLHHDIRRIASTAFASSSIDPSLIAFATRRAAGHWGLAQEVIESMVAARLLATSATLSAQLYPQAP